MQKRIILLLLKGRSRISKAGGKIYRGSLFMAATVAQIAVMRKLVIIAHSLFKSG